MARKAVIHRAVVELAHVDRGVYEELSLTVARHPSETAERMLVRLLAFALRYEEGLEFGRGVSTPDEPDAWSRDPDGRVRQWIEVGQPGAQRLVKASRRAERATVWVFGAGSERWRQARLEGLEAPRNLHVARIDDAFVAGLAAGLERSLRWSLTVSAGFVFLRCGDRRLETAPLLWLGDPMG
ncbi:MAG: YaeQ family protein [Myxococcota bacterium]|nr:YaeQ family protein [Myxococcota bacterium]